MAAKNPMHQPSGRIFLVGVLRFADKAVVAYYSNGEADKEGVRELVASNSSAKLGMRYSVTGSSQAVHYLLDQSSRVFVVVTDPKYPVRVAFGILDELQINFTNQYGSKIPGSSEDGLNKVSRPLLKEVADKYADPAAADQLVAVQAKIDVVKTEMQQNIQQLLINTEQMKHIEESAVELNAKSEEFKQGTKELRHKMWLKNIKMKLLWAGLIIAILIVIIVPAVITGQGASNSSN